MTVKHLGDTNFEVIMECFLAAFENYFVKMPTDYSYYKEGWKAAGVKYDLSYGMFDNGKLVGFIINAIDKRHGNLTAYNSGTGVLPNYRGRRIVKMIYDYAIPDLIKNGITKCQLEVITENEKAIKSYEGIGFEICKKYKCYAGSISIEPQIHFSLKEIDVKTINWEMIPNQSMYSWDNQSQSLDKGNFSYFQVLVKDEVQSFFIINPENGYVAQFEVLKESILNWDILFSAIKTIKKDLRINNIDDRLIAKIKAVESIGLKNTVDQYEMELLIK